MGQYGNQPDFGTIVDDLETIGLSNTFQPSAIYVGKTNDGTDCKLRVLPVGNDSEIEITGISQGTFLPIVVTKISVADNIEKVNVLLYR